MTRLQRRILLYIQDEQDCGRSVRVRDVSNALGASATGFVHDAMTALVEQGYLTHMPRRARSYEVVRRIEPIVQWYVFDDETKELRKVEKVMASAAANAVDAEIRAEGVR